MIVKSNNVDMSAIGLTFFVSGRAGIIRALLLDNYIEETEATMGEEPQATGGRSRGNQASMAVADTCRRVAAYGGNGMECIEYT